jgi:hypothetical protein
MPALHPDGFLTGGSAAGEAERGRRMRTALDDQVFAIRAGGENFGFKVNSRSDARCAEEEKDVLQILVILGHIMYGEACKRSLSSLARL